MKKTLLFILFVFIPLSVFAIPGVTEVMPTESGQFVFYRDYTFKSETYIGFLQYDEGTYAIRYYAPAPEVGSSEIELLITIDPTQNYVLMTGEKIVSQVTMDDNTTINYLHDLFYEFASRRKRVDFPSTQLSELEKLKSLKNSTVKKSEDFFQYGGEVVIEYDFSLPLFSLRNISSGGEVLFEAVTMGQLISDDDRSFVDFKGFPTLPSNKKNSSLVQNDMDALWVESQPNFWFINDDALLYSYDIEMSQDFFATESYGAFDYFSRKLSLSASPTYVYLPEQSVYENKGLLIISNVIYLPQSNTFTKDTKIIAPPSDITGDTQLYTLTTISAYYEFYFSNEAYFNEKIDSFLE